MGRGGRCGNERAASSIEIVGRTLSRDALLLSRVAAPADAEIARLLVVALRDPRRVAQFLEIDEEVSHA